MTKVVMITIHLHQKRRRMNAEARSVPLTRSRSAQAGAGRPSLYAHGLVGDLPLQWGILQPQFDQNPAFWLCGDFISPDMSFIARLSRRVGAVGRHRIEVWLRGAVENRQHPTKISCNTIELLKSLWAARQAQLCSA